MGGDWVARWLREAIEIAEFGSGSVEILPAWFGGTIAMVAVPLLKDVVGCLEVWFRASEGSLDRFTSLYCADFPVLFDGLIYCSGLPTCFGASNRWRSAPQMQYR